MGRGRERESKDCESSVWTFVYTQTQAHTESDS